MSNDEEEDDEFYDAEDEQTEIKELKLKEFNVCLPPDKGHK